MITYVICCCFCRGYTRKRKGYDEYEATGGKKKQKKGGKEYRPQHTQGYFFGISFGANKLFVTFLIGDFRRSRQSTLYKSELQFVALICTMPATFNSGPILSPRLLWLEYRFRFRLRYENLCHKFRSQKTVNLAQNNKK